MCLFVWVLFHYGPCVSLFSFRVFMVFVEFLGLKAAAGLNTPSGIKRPRYYQPPEITLTTHSMHTPLALIFCVASVFLTNDAT